MQNNHSNLPEFYIGIMSGTSLDGIDAVLAGFSDNKYEVVSYANLDFDTELKDVLLELQNVSENEIHKAQLAANNLAIHYAELVSILLEKSGIAKDKVKAIGSHGQTIRHQPKKNDVKNAYTLQLQNPSLLAELTGINVIANFREADIAAGGQGAPLVPAFHADYFKHVLAEYTKIVVCNIGGMSNITILSQDKPVMGMDCGAGNVLLDSWIKHSLNKDFDENGSWAKQGQLNSDLLTIMLNNEYFKQSLPKSTGRELFNLEFIINSLNSLKISTKLNIQPEDVQTTLVHLTAKSIAQDIYKYADCKNDDKKLLAVCGGGAKNNFILETLAYYLADYKVCTTSELGLDTQNVEALAFAWLAKQYIENKPSKIGRAHV